LGWNSSLSTKFIPVLCIPYALNLKRILYKNFNLMILFRKQSFMVGIFHLRCYVGAQKISDLGPFQMLDFWIRTQPGRHSDPCTVARFPQKVFPIIGPQGGNDGNLLKYRFQGLRPCRFNQNPPDVIVMPGFYVPSFGNVLLGSRSLAIFLCILSKQNRKEKIVKNETGTNQEGKKKSFCEISKSLKHG
jgi:hypothetical protein